MPRFTAILLSISLWFLPAYALEVCVPVGAYPYQLQELNGIELALSELGLNYTRSFNCTKVVLKFPGGSLSPDELLPSKDTELSQIEGLIEGNSVAVVYRKDLEDLASALITSLQEKGVSVFVYSYPPGKENYLDILKPLVELKEEEKRNIDTVVFLGYYEEAVLVLPFFRIFHPFPRVVATWRIYNSLLFAYRSFMKTVRYYEWFPSWYPLFNIRGFVISYIKHYGRLPTRFAALGYDAALLVAGALEKNVPVNDVRILGATNLIGLDESGKPVRAYYLVDIGALPELPPPYALK